MMSRILVVDDSMLIRMRLQQILEEVDGVDSVRGEHDPEEALRIVIQEKPDVVILDIHMPGMSGLELLGRIRDGDENGPKVFMYSNHSASQYEETCLNKGANKYFDKTRDLDDLIETVRRESYA